LLRDIVPRNDSLTAYKCHAELVSASKNAQRPLNKFRVTNEIGFPVFMYEKKDFGQAEMTGKREMI